MVKTYAVNKGRANLRPFQGISLERFKAIETAHNAASNKKDRVVIGSFKKSG